MNLEDVKELIKEEFMNNVMSNLDSTLIFTYVKSLEDRLNRAIEILKHNNHEYEGAVYEALRTLRGEDNE